jgi:hypothetical protein
MKLNGKTYGVPIVGTELIKHGNAPRRCPSDPNRMGWFECRRCGEFKAIRVQSVMQGATKSCGCKGRRQAIAHDQQRADNLLAAPTPELTSDLAGRPHHWKQSPIYALAEKCKPAKSVIDFVGAAQGAILRVMARAGKVVFNALQWPAYYYVSHYLSDSRLFPGA